MERCEEEYGAFDCGMLEEDIVLAGLRRAVEQNELTFDEAEACREAYLGQLIRTRHGS